VRYILVFLIRTYQAISRWTPRVCRFEPSCSEYARLAILKHGALGGCCRAGRRLLKCHPWHPGGLDPVD